MSTVPILGIIGSSGGSALAAASRCLADAGQEQPWCVVTDRDCGMSTWAETHAATACRIDYTDPISFSETALSFFRRQNVKAVLLFYTRIIAPPLIEQLATFNIHPSALPAFPGMGAVRRALRAGADHIGATLHIVDSGLDTGPIVLQAATGIESDCTIERAERISFVQKTWLTLQWREMMLSGNRSPTVHRFSTPLRDAFQSFQKELGCFVVDDQDM